MIDLSQAIWRKARRSAHNGGCVEIAANLPGVTAIRDSKRPEGGAHVIGRALFAEFLAEVKEGRYDQELGHNGPDRKALDGCRHRGLSAACLVAWRGECAASALRAGTAPARSAR